jgi:hypothetical protein
MNYCFAMEFKLSAQQNERKGDRFNFLFENFHIKSDHALKFTQKPPPSQFLIKCEKRY